MAGYIQQHDRRHDLQPDQRLGDRPALDLTFAASLSADEVMRRLDTSASGLTTPEVKARLEQFGSNTVRSDRARALSVLVRQFRSPLLLLLFLAATASFFLGERADAVIIGVILAVSVGLGFGNEYRAEKAAEALHTQIRHTCVVLRDRARRPST